MDFTEQLTSYAGAPSHLRDSVALESPPSEAVSGLSPVPPRTSHGCGNSPAALKYGLHFGHQVKMDAYL